MNPQDLPYALAALVILCPFALVLAALILGYEVTVKRRPRPQQRQPQPASVPPAVPAQRESAEGGRF